MSDDQQVQANEPTDAVPAVDPVEPIVYHFEPANPGESFVSLGIPARDLTQRDWDGLSLEAQIAATTPGPSGEAMYTKLTRAERTAAKKAAEAAEQQAAEAAARERKAAEAAERRAAEEAAKGKKE